MEWFTYVLDTASAVSNFYSTNPVYAYFTYIGGVVLIVLTTKAGD